MKVHLLQMDPKKWAQAEDFRFLHAAAREKLHELVEDPGEADLILLLGEWVLNIPMLLENPHFRKYRPRCAAYYDGGHYLPIVPGVFDSVVRGMHSRMGLAKTSCYAPSFGSYKNHGLESMANERLPKRWLFTFKGGSTSLLRKRLYRIDFKRSDVAIEDTSHYLHWTPPSESKLEGQKAYARMMLESHFALCPRGHGVGTIRFFEAMQMGIAPVLIADDYVLPEGPDWDSFLIRVPESHIRQLPQILEKRVGESEELSRRARQTWEKWFSESEAFNHIIGAAGQTLEAAKKHQSFLLKTQPFVIARFQARESGYRLARNAVLGTLRALHIKSPYRLNRPE